MRCRPLATDAGDSTCTTRSMAPMSMPSSRLEVATSAGSLPALRASSISSRCSRATEPWWARTRSSPASSLSRAASRSASRRELTKISVDRWLRIRSSRTGCIAGQIEWRTSGLPAAGPDSSSPSPSSIGLAQVGHVLDRDDDLELQGLAHAGVDHGDRAGLAAGPAAEEPGHLLERALGGRQADALGRPLGQALQPLQ